LCSTIRENSDWASSDEKEGLGVHESTESEPAGRCIDREWSKPERITPTFANLTSPGIPTNQVETAAIPFLDPELIVNPAHNSQCPRATDGQWCLAARSHQDNHG
jgi:hypothetical protein